VLREEQIDLRRQRGRAGRFTIANLGTKRVFSDFAVTNPATGGRYTVAVRGFDVGDNTCTCPDFKANTLGTCKHIEAVLLHLEARYKKPFRTAHENGSERIDIVPDAAAGTMRAAGDLRDLPKPLRDVYRRRRALAGRGRRRWNA
jgi:SWIM zinc finger